MKKFSNLLCVAGVMASGLLTAPALAGDGNQLNVLQSSPNGSLNGNTLSIDQSAATDSVVGGLTPDSIGVLAAYTLSLLSYDSSLAAQLGEGNSADVNIHGYGARVELLQASDPRAPWAPGSAVGNNNAVVNASGGTLGAVIQVGLNNSATLNLNGEGAKGLITQLGSDLSSELNFQGSGTGTVVQVGNNSSTGTVMVAPGSQVSYTQFGDNLAPVDPSGGLSVLWSTGGVTITQTAW